MRSCAVSELRSAIEGLRAETLPELPDARIEEDFAELQRALELLDAERLRRLAEIDRRRLFERDGHLSTGRGWPPHTGWRGASLASMCAWHADSRRCRRPAGP
jgi:hypothetical protein